MCIRDRSAGARVAANEDVSSGPATEGLVLIFRRGSRWPAPASGPAFGWPPSGLGRRVLAVNRPAGYLTRGFDARRGFGTMATSHHVVGDVRRAWCEGGRTLCRADLPGTPIPGLIELGVETRSEEPGAAGRHVTRSSGIVRPARTSTQTIVPSRIGPISTTITSPGPSGVAVGVGLRPLAPRRPRTGPTAPGGTGGGPDARAANSPPKQRPGGPGRRGASGSGRATWTSGRPPPPKS